MPALPLFFLVATVALISTALWLLARSPEGVATDERLERALAKRDLREELNRDLRD